LCLCFCGVEWLCVGRKNIQVAQLGVRQYYFFMLDICAANDAVFYKSRCRTLPISATVTTVANYPTKLTIFLTNASRFWQVRCFFDGKVVIRSLRTTHKRDALYLARRFYDTELVRRGVKIETANVSSGISQTHSISVAATLMLQDEHARVERGEVAKHSYTMLCSRVRKHIVPFFEKIPVEQIDYAQIQRFFNFLSTQSYKSITLSQYLMTLRKILNTAHAYNWIVQVPQFPKIKTSSTARGGFTAAEYLQLLRCAKKLRKIKSKKKKATHRNTHDGIYTATDAVPFEMAWLIGFMVNSFVRPVDIKLIQHKHVEVVRGEHCYLRLTLPETKKHTGQIITLPAAVHIYESLSTYFGKKGLAGEEDYLFLPHIPDRLAAITLMEKYFRQILIAAELRYGNQKQRRSLYSLRHSAITFRLLYGRGIDLLTLARNARTSLEMVDKFYASELRAEMNVGMLHSRR